MSGTGRPVNRNKSWWSAVSAGAQLAPDPRRNLRQDRLQSGAILAATLRHVRTPAALAADPSGDEADEFPRLCPPHRGPRDPGHQCDLAVAGTREHDHRV